MANGKVARDIIGHRTVITSTCDYVPTEKITALISLLAFNPFLFVDYPSPNELESGVFEIDYPSLDLFGFKNGVAVWHNITLTMTAQEVT